MDLNYRTTTYSLFVLFPFSHGSFNQEDVQVYRQFSWKVKVEFMNDLCNPYHWGFLQQS